jgi:peptidoglycan hydrolase-like protein with peptidoglycan-binding domain
MQAQLIPVLQKAGIPRAEVRLWSAHFAGTHICGPSTCSELSIDADGTQHTDRAFGRDLDQSLLLASFFDAPATPKPAPSPAPDPVPAWQEAIMNKLPVLAEGAKDTGEPWMVRRVQALCNALGTPCAIDGDFGAATKAAVEAVQHDHGVAVDGTVGPVTWSVLVTGSAP